MLSSTKRKAKCKQNLIKILQGLAIKYFIAKNQKLLRDIMLKKISEINLNPENPRIIEDHKFKLLVKSIQSFPEMLELRPIVVDENFQVLGGNMRLRACKEAGLEEVHISIAEGLTEDQKKEFIIKDNASFGQWDWEVLSTDTAWKELEIGEWGIDAPDFDIEDPAEEKENKKLNDIFIVPPFSVLDSRQGYWLQRKKYWRDLIGDNGESREGTLGTSELMTSINSGVSILDPVLAELSNRWFGTDNCKTFDCFAGDSVFGYVSDALGNQFTGIELRKEQADLNNSRLAGTESKYICDNGVNVLNHIKPNSQDLLFSCPPYFDLEVYSDLKDDASNQKDYQDFLKIIDQAFTNSIKCLKDDSFAVIVVGDIRNQGGFYYGFPEDIKRIFQKSGLKIYNEMVLLNSIGTLPVRVGNYMKSRKIGKCHQNVLVFYKGDWKNISKKFKKLDFSKLDLQGEKDESCNA